MKHESLLDRLMEQPLAAARKKAIQEGRELGARETILDTLLEVLDVRFHEQDVALYTPIFEAITDVQLLRQLLHTALRVPTFDDVMQTLKDYRNQRDITSVLPNATNRWHASRSVRGTANRADSGKFAQNGAEDTMKHESLLDRLTEQPLEEARKEGRELGARETAIHSLMAVLDARFQDCNVQILKPTFEAITDLQRLNQLLRTAAQASTIDEVTQTLVQPRNNEA